ncbi:hypothetical protein QJS10_CPB13g01132 [Acorus calamus]|uniref:Uncharacterized protein n=1 Tax=Acorus calamus TaxID=4465 RepID=A0AAV9DFH2_ACOCL|nr:hypothetical protein QJS10_CPB13g01132 [Acorus calamus]
MLIGDPSRSLNGASGGRRMWRPEEGSKDCLTTSHKIESDESNPGVVMPVTRDE